jgi:hypothetical protein
LVAGYQRKSKSANRKRRKKYKIISNLCHSRACGNLEVCIETWIPACAGMTD